MAETIPILMDGSEPEVAQADISRRAVSLGRYLDRLPEGEYVLLLSKDDTRWKVNVLDAQTRRIMNILR